MKIEEADGAEPRIDENVRRIAGEGRARNPALRGGRTSLPLQTLPNLALSDRPAAQRRRSLQALIISTGPHDAGRSMDIRSGVHGDAGPGLGLDAIPSAKEQAGRQDPYRVLAHCLSLSQNKGGCIG